MEHIDLSYLCTVIGSLCGIPIRLFSGDKLVFYYSLVNLPADPFSLYQDEIRKVKKNVGYFVTRHFHYYGIVNSKSRKIVIGPSRQITGDDQELWELAFRLDLHHEEASDFVQGMKAIIPMPLERILQIMCTMNHVLNGEKLSLRDISIYDAEQDALKHQITSQQTAAWDHEQFAAGNVLHNTYGLEQTLMQIIRKGDTAALRKWVESAPAVRGGVLAEEQLRQMKNTFIVTTTLASRSAIRGGMDVDAAFALSDSYIRKCELLPTPDRIMNLQYCMILDFTQHVERIRLGSHPTKLAMDVANYVQKHLSQPISTQAMADSMFISRTHLSRRFREKTGQTLTDYILKEKTEEAKRLLRYSDKSLTAISGYLGFSSPGHFSRVFRKYAACTPSEYRDKIAK